MDIMAKNLLIFSHTMKTVFMGSPAILLTTHHTRFAVLT